MSSHHNKQRPPPPLTCENVTLAPSEILELTSGGHEGNESHVVDRPSDPPPIEVGVQDAVDPMLQKCAPIRSNAPVISKKEQIVVSSKSQDPAAALDSAQMEQAYERDRRSLRRSGDGSATEGLSGTQAPSSESSADLGDIAPGALAVSGLGGCDVSSVDEESLAPLPTLNLTIVAEAERVNETEEGEWKQRATSLQQTLDNAPRAQVVVVAENKGTTPTRIRPRLWAWMMALLLILGLVGAVIVSFLAGGSNDEEKQPVVANITQDNDELFLVATPNPTLPPTMQIPTSAPALPPTIQMVRQRGYLRCRPDPDEIALGHGFSSDLCKAIAAVILGDASKVKFTLMPFKEQFMAVANGTTDVTTGLTYSTMERDVHVAEGLKFSTPYIYSGNAWIGIPEFVDCVENEDMLVGVCRDLRVCVLSGGLQETELMHISHPLYGVYLHKVEGSSVDIYRDFADNHCNVAYTTAMGSFLQNAKEANHSTPIKMSEKIYNTIPLALVSRNDDPQFGDLVNWIIHSMLKAEALNITKDAAQLFPETKLFDGDSTIFQRALAVLGNYAEVYQQAWQSEFPRQAINNLHSGPQDGGLLFPRPLGKLDAGSVAHIIDAKSLNKIGQQGGLRCGIIMGRPGLASWNKTLRDYVGIDVDQCRGLGAALFAGAKSSLEFVEYASEGDGFVGLAGGMVDVLVGAEYSMVNDIQEENTGQGFAFSDIYYYDQQGSETIPLAIATTEDDAKWSDFVGLVAMASLHAEANGINQTSAAKMPVLDVYGPQYSQALRDVILCIGNYAEQYERNMEMIIPRSENPLNTLNTGANPMFYANYKF